MNETQIAKDTLRVIAVIGSIHFQKGIDFVDAKDVFDLCYNGHNIYTLEYLEAIFSAFKYSSLFTSKTYLDGKTKYQFFSHRQ